MLTLAKTFMESNIVASNTETPRRPMSLKDFVQQMADHHLVYSDSKTLRNGDLYEKFQQEMEQGLIAAVLRFTGGNESRACRILGLSRGTLRQRRALFGDYGKAAEEIQE
jgi:Fis family transcriptional regulator